LKEEETKRQGKVKEKGPGVYRRIQAMIAEQKKEARGIKMSGELARSRVRQGSAWGKEIYVDFERERDILGKRTSTKGRLRKIYEGAL